MWVANREGPMQVSRDLTGPGFCSLVSVWRVQDRWAEMVRYLTQNSWPSDTNFS
jgi:hypothetical protein